MVKKKDYSLAVHRNKIKRWIREIFHHSGLNGGYVVVVRFGFLEMGYKKVKNVGGIRDWITAGGPTET